MARTFGCPSSSTRRIADPAPVARSASLTRRRFAQGAAALAGGVTIVPAHVLGGPGKVAPSDKTVLAGIGLGGQGTQDIQRMLQFDEVRVTAVCDVDRESGGFLSWNWDRGKGRRTAGREPARRMVDAHYGKRKTSGLARGCRAYADYRELLAREDVDAVVVATPDHTHAVIAMAAIQKGKHVYCEKPLTWSVGEARAVVAAARKHKVATQLGNQGQADEADRIAREIIQDGAIGQVREVHAWCPPRFWPMPAGMGRPADTPPVPKGLDWDLWLGPAPERPYHPAYHPWTWRNWWDFGTGLLGDLGCHKLSTVFKALQLTHPTTVEASSTVHEGEVYPHGVTARLEFPARGDLAPLTLCWSDGGLKAPRPKALEPGRGMATVIYLGEKGTLMGHRLVPESAMKKYGRPPRRLPRSPGHDKEWIDACRGGAPAGSDFARHSGVLTEAILLPNVALRARKKLHWDGPAARVTNDKKANQLLRREYRKGWTL